MRKTVISFALMRHALCALLVRRGAAGRKSIEDRLPLWRLFSHGAASMHFGKDCASLVT